MPKTIILAALLSFATFGLQACVSESSQTTQPQYSQNQTPHTVCDANGNNCQPCDPSTNCQAATTKKFWGFFF